MEVKCPYCGYMVLIAQQICTHCRKNPFMTPTELIERLCFEGGAIVSSNECSEMEIADAMATKRFAVDEEGFGYVRRYKEWLERHKYCKSEAPVPAEL